MSYQNILLKVLLVCCVLFAASCLTLQSANVHDATGTVKWFDQPRGYGFITPDDGSANAYVR